MSHRRGFDESKFDTASDEEEDNDEGMNGETEGDLMDFMVRFSAHVDSLEFNKRMATFFRDHCHIVDLSTTEHSHEVYEVYEAYTEHIDVMLEDFVKKEKLPSAEALVAKVREASEMNTFASEYVQFILQVVDFESFAKCLRQYWAAFARNNGIPLDGPVDHDAKDNTIHEDSGLDIDESKASESKSSHK